MPAVGGTVRVVSSPEHGPQTFGSVLISLFGHFNPMILQPHWLLANGLIDEADWKLLVEEQEERFVVSPEFAGFRLPWATMETTTERCQVMSEAGTDTPDRIREFVVGVFALLPHTPVERLA